MLNFACQVAPGRAFCRRLIDSTCKVKQSWHIIRVSDEMKADLQVLLTFLKYYNGVSVMLDQFWTSNETLQLLTDRSGGIGNGFGKVFNNKWTHGKWSAHWVENAILRDMTFLRSYFRWLLLWKFEALICRIKKYCLILIIRLLLQF